MNSKSPSRQSIIESFSWLAFGTICWLSVLVFVELAPKNGSPRSSMRLIFLIAFFASWAGVWLHVKAHAHAFLYDLYRWRYEDAPLGIDKSWKYQVEEFSFILSALSWHNIALSTTTVMYVLGYWFPLPAIVDFFVTLAWLGSILAMAVFTLRVPKNIGKVFEQFRFLRRQLATCDYFEPRLLAEVWNPMAKRTERRKVTAPTAGFIAANRPWHFSRLTKNVIAFGAIGSGKTTCVMNVFLDKCIESRGQQQPLGGLLLDYKGEFLDKAKRLCIKHGRPNDLIVLSADSEWSWNPIGGDDPASEIAARFVAAMKALGHQDRQTSFFIHQSETFLEHAITLLRSVHSSPELVNLPSVHRIANDIEYMDATLEKLAVADQADESSALSRCHRYFKYELFQMALETRQSVIATLNNMLNPLCNELVTPILSSGQPLDLKQATMGSKIVYLNLRQSDAPRAGRLLGILLKLAIQDEVLRKPVQCRRYSFLFADEFQEFFTGDAVKGDIRFFSLSRDYDHINIVATQNINNLLIRADNPQAVMSLLGNIKTKIFLQNSDKETNEYASQLFGNHVEELGGGHHAGHAQVMNNVRHEDFLQLQTPVEGQSSFATSFMLDESGAKVDLASRMTKWPFHGV